MADISSIIERLKNNKLAIPALAVGAVVGGYALLKGGGLSGGGGGFSGVDPSAIAPASAAPGASGGGGNEAVGEVLAQQQTFAQSITDQFNKLVEGVQGALGAQSSQTQSAIDALAGAQQGIVGQVQDQLSQQAQAIGSGYATPDFSSLFNAIAQIPQQVAPQFQAPQLGSGAQNVTQKIAKSVAPIITRNYSAPAPRPITINKAPKAKTPIRFTLPAGVRGSITPTYNSPRIQSSGGFGTSKVASSVKKVAAKVKR